MTGGRRSWCVVLLVAGVASGRFAVAQAAGPDAAWNVNGQLTVIDQGHGGFAAAYSGANSLAPRRESETSTTATLFLTVRLWRGAEFVLVPEAAGGRGLSGVTGMAGFPNGDIVRVSDPQLTPYLARAFLRQPWGLGDAMEKVEGDAMQLAGERPLSRLTVTAGKFAATDCFDDNTYSHDPRTQFMNWSLMDGASWDYPADTRGYSWGLVLELNQPIWAVRVGSFMVPLKANGMALDHEVRQDRGDVVEFEFRQHVSGRPGKFKFLAYQNHARMGTYALALLEAGPQPPDITTTRQPGTLKHGFGVNVEQQLTDGIGAFARWGWNDGRTESWAFTEVDRTASAGLQLDGALWSRSNDTAGIAYVANGLAPEHRAYLAAGGLGFIIGDGALNYGRERITEAYYKVSVGSGIALGVDFQRVTNPAYNRDRGPVSIVAVRLHWEI